MFDIPAGGEILHGRVHESFPVNGQVYAPSSAVLQDSLIRCVQDYGANWWTRSLDNDMSMYSL